MRIAVETLTERGERYELGLLFHRLNNQLGIILAHAELLEAKAPDEMNRARAGHVIGSVLDALGTTKDLRIRVQSAHRLTSHDVLIRPDDI